jgi:two-component system phosphate regulon response regulator PhoB
VRRTTPDAADVLQAGGITIDRRTLRVTRGGREIKLSRTELRLLDHLMSNAGRVYSRAEILAAVWGRKAGIDQRTVDVHIGRLRRAIDRERKHHPIRTVRGIGYAFEPSSPEAAAGPEASD